METCTDEFARLAHELGGITCDGNMFITVKNPFALDNWTLPLVELLLVAGAAAALVHAVRWRRRTGDSSNLIVWFASVFCLMLIEPIAYFPQWFGLEDALGLTFVHNQFSIQFLYNRLPLYIIAMYPAFGYLAYILVQRTGILARHNVLIGATCVAFVFHCFYEVIDTIGPQFRWWVWNEDLSTSTPALGVVPYLNLQAFSLAIPFGITLVTGLVSTSTDSGFWTTVRNIALVSVLVWPVMFMSSLPATIIDMAGASTETARLYSTWALIVLAGLITAVTFIKSCRHRRTDRADLPAGVEHDHFALACSVIYLVVAASFWIAALPDYLDSSDGLTPAGDPVGNLPYGALTFALSIAIVVGTQMWTGVARVNPPHVEPRSGVSA